MTGSGPDYSRLSLWHDTLVASGTDDLSPRPGLVGDTSVDVCIVGAGYTGLWTAYYLLAAQPSLRVLLVEAEVAGFGASGRNGGWCSALFPTSTARLARRHGPDAALAMRRTMNATVAEVGRVAAAEGIDCHYRHGGTVVLARTPVQLARVRAEVHQDARFEGVDGWRLLTQDEARQRVGARGVLGGMHTPHCARIHPARLVRGLAAAVERRGAQIAERTRVHRIIPAADGADPSVVTDRGTVSARHVIRATEAFTAGLPGLERDLVPVFSLMVATEPLPASFWQTAGLHQGETFSDARHLIIYGQRTADDRFAFGGRGAPYHPGSKIEPAFDRDPRVFALLQQTLIQMFPELSGHAFTHSWGGPVGIARDWHASVGLDPAGRVGWAGGYVGDGVGTANLSGRTLADLVLGRQSELTRLPWVGHRSPRWEPEPWRWLGINAGLRVMSVADHEERVTRRGSLVARMLAPLLGH